MAASQIEGTLVEAQVKRSLPKVTMYSKLRFELAGGGTQELLNAVVSNEVADLLQADAKGRFVLFSTIDMRGVHGAKLTDGAAAQGYPGRGNRPILWLALIFGLVGTAFFPLFTGTIHLIPLLPLVFGALGLFITNKTESEARAVFDSLS